MRVHELAKTLHLSSKELLAKLKTLRINAKSAMATLVADAINRERKALVIRPPAQKSAATTTRAKPATALAGS